MTPKGGMLLFRALGGLGDEVRHGQKAKKFSEIISQILIVDISASEPSIEKVLKWFEAMGYPIMLKQLDFFYVQQLTRKLVKISATPSQFFSKYPPNYKS